MNDDLHVVSKNGKVCYLEIPAVDIKESAEFYEKVFGWKIRTCRKCILPVPIDSLRYYERD